VFVYLCTETVNITTYYDDSYVLTSHTHTQHYAMNCLRPCQMTGCLVTFTRCYTVSCGGRLSGAFAKLLKATNSLVMSVRMEQLGSHRADFHVCFFKIRRANSDLVKFWQEWVVPYTETIALLWSYLAEFFLEWQLFQTKFVEKIKKHIFFISAWPCIIDINNIDNQLDATATAY